MHNDRVVAEDVAQDVYRYVFDRLDSEPHLTGEDAGRLAAECQKAIQDYLTETWGIDG
jgi:uncharacterized protein (DUF2267 family)